MIDHMNEDHQDAMSLILAHHHAIQDDTPTMTGIVNDGFYIHSNNKNYYVPFENRCIEQGSARTELVRLTNRARKAQAA